MNILFSETRPCAKLAPFVQTYWYGDFNISDEKDFKQSVLPNGCIELIIHLSDAHCFLFKKDDWNISPTFTLLGMHTKPYSVQFCTNVKVFGIRFYPDGFKNIFGVAPSEFLAGFEDGLDVVGKGIDIFCRQMKKMKGPGDQIRKANEFLLYQLSIHHRSGDYTHHAMQLIRKTSGAESYASVLASASISGRQLQREFRNLYGITVRDYMRLVRINAVQRYMQVGVKNLTHLGYQLEFSDQSHFIKEFKNYIGLPPKRFLKIRDRYIINPVIYEAQT